MRDILCFMAIPLSKYKDKAGDQGGNIARYIAKILSMPNNQSVNHWKNEIGTFITNITEQDVKSGKKKYSYFMIPYSSVRSFKSMVTNLYQHPDYKSHIEVNITGEELMNRTLKFIELLDADRLITGNDDLPFETVVKNLDEALK